MKKIFLSILIMSMFLLMASFVSATEICGWNILGADTNTRFHASVGDTDSPTWSRLSPAVLQLYSSNIDPEIILREDGTGSIWNIKNSRGNLGQFQISQYGFPYFVIQSGSGEVGINKQWPTKTLDVNGSGRFNDLYVKDFLELSPLEHAPPTVKGRIYLDSSNALCFSNGKSWEKIAGRGKCNSLRLE